MWCFQSLLAALGDGVITEEHPADQVRQTLNLFLHKVCESTSCRVKRRKERCLDEAVQLLKKLSHTQLRDLQDQDLLRLVRLLLSMQLQMVHTSTCFRKVEQMLQFVAEVDEQLVYRETLSCLDCLIHSEQILSLEDLQRACVFVEDSTAGRKVLCDSLTSLLKKLSELFPVLLQQGTRSDGVTCYNAVKVCLQMFQLLSSSVAPLVWDPDHRDPAVQDILQALMDVILGQFCSRDARLLAATAVAMLLNTSSAAADGGAAAWSLLQVSHSRPWLLTVGAHRVQCHPAGTDGLERLAVSRGLLTCCPPHILLSSQHHNAKDCLLLSGLFPLLCALCEQRQSCHYYAFEVLTLWMKKVKECLPDYWKMNGVRLMAEDSRLQQQLIHLLWTNAESPVEGVSEHVRSAFVLLLDIHEMDCNQFGDPRAGFNTDLLQRVMELPWESKAKYHHLCALVPHVGATWMLDHFPKIPARLLHCFSTNRLSPCGSELYKCLIRQQRRELCEGSHELLPELDLANQWARRWQRVLHEALTSDGDLLPSNSSTYVLPFTFQVFPAAVDLLLAPLDPCVPGHLHAWACILSSCRAVTGLSPWTSRLSSTPETLQLALGSADDKVRLAALGLLCCSPKAKDPPSAEEIQTMMSFIPHNLNCESAPFRQRFQAGVKKFVVRIRDCCLTLVRERKSRDRDTDSRDVLQQGTGFVEWLSQTAYSNLSPGHNYQRKKTALLLLCAVLETCTDTWSPDRRKGQPPANMSSLINFAKERGQWDFFCRAKQLVLITMLEDSTNEIRDLSAALLVRFFPNLPEDIAGVLRVRSQNLLRSPRVQEAQMGAVMAKVLLLRSQEQNGSTEMMCETSVSGEGRTRAVGVMGALMKELEEHYVTARGDMMSAARTKPIHGVLSALQRCFPVSSFSVHSPVDRSLLSQTLLLLESLSGLLLGVLCGERDAWSPTAGAPPSFCDMGNAISSLIADECPEEHGDECVLLSEEHSLVLTCCWVSLKEIGILLGIMVEQILRQSKPSPDSLLPKEDLMRASEVFKNILLRCRHWGAVEGCCIGFTKFCSSLLSSSDQQIRDIPAQMLKLGLQVVRCPPSTSVTRRAAGLPMLILCIVSAEEAGKARPLLALSVQDLLETARTPLSQDWDQTLDLPQVCAVHTLQTLVRGSSLGVAVLPFAAAVCTLSLMLLSSPCWAMRNAALQLYSSLCSRMLGQRSSSEEAGPAHHAMSPAAFFFHYAALQPFLLGELQEAAEDLRGPSADATLRLRPSLYPILTLLAQLQPGVQDSAHSLSDFLPPLLHLAASPVYSVRVMASKALVAIAPPSEYTSILLQLSAQLPVQQERCRHNRLHGQLLQIRAVLERALHSDGTHRQSNGPDVAEVLSRVQASLWLASAAQRCPLVRAAFLQVVTCFRGLCCQTFLSRLRDALMQDLQNPPASFQIGLPSFHQQAIDFLCADSKWAFTTWSSFSAAGPDLRLAMLSWVLDGSCAHGAEVREVIRKALEVNLKEALLSLRLAERRLYLSALIEVMPGADPTSSHRPFPLSSLDELDVCLQVLFQDLEGQEAGPEFLSQALLVASWLLSRWPDGSLKLATLERLCSVMERHRAPDVPEVLRMACAEALCVAAVCLRARSAVVTRMINTGLFLLQDQSQQVRVKAARFTSLLRHHRAGESRASVHLMHANEALQLLLGLLSGECWDAPGSLEALLCLLPPSDLTLVLREAAAQRSSSLYEQDEANVFAEPSVMAAHVLPHLLQMADKRSQCAELARRLSAWAERSASELMEGIAVCQTLSVGAFTDTWRTLLTDPRFHSALNSLIAKSALFLRLVNTSDRTERLGGAAASGAALREVCVRLTARGVPLPPALTAAV